ncbi:MAG: hypothetical protein IBX50_11135 [Marinospirillum sp.]|uniref:hypothetical protein n=1 Tax=Marinospirillum sp. TaxID=2183934 RepID=UPI001A06F700|nr:hypothetical protein [Marinospirillum sp.]MBE0507257.1 hypothetical protein [Marinospirillum sp.]
MQKYRTGEELALAALQKELKRLQAKADKARAEADECANIGSELSAVHQAFTQKTVKLRHSWRRYKVRAASPLRC